jgi:hypothetical protein
VYEIGEGCVKMEMDSARTPGPKRGRTPMVSKVFSLIRTLVFMSLILCAVSAVKLSLALHYLR